MPPSTSMHPLLRRPPISDEEYVEMRDKLNNVLRMPARKRWIADWLFGDNDASFHRNIPLSFRALDHTLAIHIHRFFTEALPADSPAVSVLFQGMLPHHRQTLPPDLTLSVDDLEMLFVPVAHLDGVAVGYTLCVGLHHRPGRPAQVWQYFGRFAFDSARDDLLQVYHGAPPQSSDDPPAFTVLVGARRLESGCKDFYTIVCPKEQYGFEYLPNRILSASTGRVVRKRTVPKRILVQQSECYAISNSSAYIESGCSNGAVVSRQCAASAREGASSTVDQVAVRGSLKGMQKAMVAEVHARRFFTNFITGRRSWVKAEVGPGVRKSFQLADDLLANKLGIMIVQQYCASVLAVPRDEYQLAIAAASGNEAEEEESLDETSDSEDEEDSSCGEDFEQVPLQGESFYVCVRKRRRTG